MKGFADRDGIVRLWNRAAEGIFGYTEEEAIGQSLDLIIPERQRELHWKGYGKVAGPVAVVRDVTARWIRDKGLPRRMAFLEAGQTTLL